MTKKSNITSLADHKAKKEDKILNASVDLSDTLAEILCSHEPKGTDNSQILFTMFVNLIVILNLIGWSEKNLKKQVTEYCKDFGVNSDSIRKEQLIDALSKLYDL